MNILLVEDDPVNLALCEAFLNGLGHSVLAVDDAEKAWLSLSAQKFQIIISDWILPGQSGIDLCKRVRQRKSGEYSFFMTVTSYQGRDKLNEAMDAGVDDFLTKPIDLDTLAVRLRVASRILDFHRQIGILQDLLPICMYCKKIRNDQAYWETVENYFSAHVGADFTHSLCPDCYTRHILPELGALRKENEATRQGIAGTAGETGEPA
ncbi:MAG: response regulator [Fibrobacteria bacterium]